MVPERGGAIPPGFTLLEMLVVIAVLGLVLGIFIGRGPMRSPALDLRAAAADVAQALRATRARAIATDRASSFALDPAAHRYVAAGVSHALPAALSAAINAPGGVIQFAPDGSSSGGRVTLGEAERAIVVSVDWLTGRVRVAAGS